MEAENEGEPIPWIIRDHSELHKFLHTWQQGPSYFAEWPRYCNQYEHKRDEEIPESFLVFDRIGDGLLGHTSAEGDQHNSDDHDRRVFYPEEAIEGIFHHFSAGRQVGYEYAIASEQPLLNAEQQGDMRRYHGDKPEFSVGSSEGLLLLPGGVTLYNGYQKADKNDPTKEIM